MTFGKPSPHTAAVLGPQSFDGPSPLTGYGRDSWVALLASLTAAFDAAATASGSPARPWFPGSTEPALIEGLEGFARMSVAWGAWLGEPQNPAELTSHGRTVDVLRLYATALRDGTRRGGEF